MKSILSVLVIALFVTIIHGFPQQGQSTPSSQIDNQSDKTKDDTLTQSKPLDRSQISTLPASVNITKSDTIPSNKDDNIKTSTSTTTDSDSKQDSNSQNSGNSRNTRDTSKVDSNKKQDQIQHIAKDPATLDSNKKQNFGPQVLPEEGHSRKTRGADNSKQSHPSDIEANRPHQPQIHQGRDNKPSHLTKDVPVPSNAHHPAGQVHNPKH